MGSVGFPNMRRPRLTRVRQAIEMAALLMPADRCIAARFVTTKDHFDMFVHGPEVKDGVSDSIAKNREYARTTTRFLATAVADMRRQLSPGSSVVAGVLTPRSSH